jgi:hypothetical protein
MRIRLVKTPPAYVIDGFDMRGLRADHTYDLDASLANYLVKAGYGIRVDDNSNRPQPPHADTPSPDNRQPR